MTPGWARLLQLDDRLRTASLAFSAVYVTSLLVSWTPVWLSLALLIVTFALIWFYAGLLWPFASQAWLLGALAGLCMGVYWLKSTSQPVAIFCLYLHTFLMFHFTEFLFTGLTNNKNLKADSFLLNHSAEYWVAAVVSWLEFGIETVIMPFLLNKYISFFGLSLCMLGEFLRKKAMWDANTAFTHLIAVRKQQNHHLVQDGVYAVCRHPGYVGWFLWSVGTQIMLCNPFCVAAYAVVTYRFFDDRIYEEERYLVEFFGDRYTEYQKRVPVGIPLIRGYTISSSQ